MKDKIFFLWLFLKLQVQLLFSFKKKVIIVGSPLYGNLGDQAQYMVINNWAHKNFPKYRIIRMGYLIDTMAIYGGIKGTLITVLSAFITLLTLKFSIRCNDIFIGHSGYFFDDHHPGWKTFADIIRFFPKNKFIILPQTVTFSSRFYISVVKQAFLHKDNVLLFCRDKRSFIRAKELFPTIKLELQPDVVTSLVGTYVNENKRDGILFCIRNDGENFYNKDQIRELENKFGSYEEFDTTLIFPYYFIDKNRKSLIHQMIDKISKAKVVITDKYHGVIFSAIANTPVIALASSDYKLESGVNWFVSENYENVKFAKSLDEAYHLAMYYLTNNEVIFNNSSNFKKNYFDKIFKICQKDFS